LSPIEDFSKYEHPQLLAGSYKVSSRKFGWQNAAVKVRHVCGTDGFSSPSSLACSLSFSFLHFPQQHTNTHRCGVPGRQAWIVTPSFLHVGPAVFRRICVFAFCPGYPWQGTGVAERAPSQTGCRPKGASRGRGRRSPGRGGGTTRGESGPVPTTRASRCVCLCMCVRALTA